MMSEKVLLNTRAIVTDTDELLMSEKVLLNTAAIVTDTDELSLLLKITDGDESLHVVVKPEGVKLLISRLGEIVGKVNAAPKQGKPDGASQ